MTALQENTELEMEVPAEITEVEKSPAELVNEKKSEGSDDESTVPTESPSYDPEDDHSKGSLPPRARWTSFLRAGGVFGSALVLAKASIGSGVLALPGAAIPTGLGFMTGAMLVAMLANIVSIRMLAEACLKTQKWSFEAVSKELYGHWLAAFTALNMFLGQGGTMVAYTIGIADGLNVFINNAHLGNSDIKWSDFATVLIIVVLTPLCLARHINFVRYLAFLGVIGLYFLAITVIYVWARYGTAETVIEDGGAGSIWIPHNSPGFMDFVNAFSTATFAFCSQFNVPQVVHELRPCTMKRITMVAWISVLMPALLYYIVLIFSLLAFGYEDNSNLEKSLTPYVRDGDVMVYIALILTVFSLCVAYIFEVFPLRQSVAFYVAVIRKRPEDAPSNTDTRTLWWPTARFWDIIAGLLMIVLFSVIAFAWPSFNTFINFVGAFNGMYLAYICPSLFILKVRYREDPENFCWYSWGNLFYIAMGCFGLVMAVLGTVSAFVASS